MTTSERIRAAALGSTPQSPEAISCWVGNDCWKVYGLGVNEELDLFWVATDTERRFFLLFVAEALESQ